MSTEEGGLRTRDTATVVLELHKTEVMQPSLLRINDDDDFDGATAADYNDSSDDDDDDDDGQEEEDEDGDL